MEMNGTFRNNDLGRHLNNSVTAEAENGHTEKANTSLFCVTYCYTALEVDVNEGWVFKGRLDSWNGRDS